jgi:hypothetical protein
MAARSGSAFALGGSVDAVMAPSREIRATVGISSSPNRPSVMQGCPLAHIGSVSSRCPLAHPARSSGRAGARLRHLKVNDDLVDHSGSNVVRPRWGANLLSGGSCITRDGPAATRSTHARTQGSVWLSTRLTALKPFGVHGDLVRRQAVVVCYFPKLLVAAAQSEAMTVRVSHDEVSHTG